MRISRGSLRTSLFFVCLLLVFLFLILANAFGQVRPRIVEAVDNARRITLQGNVHPMAQPRFDRGSVDDAQPMTRILLLLKRSDEQEAALQDLLEKQQDKSSPSYHAWLTPAEFGAQFGVSDADIQTVTQWLNGQGFRVEKVYSNKTIIEFSGTAGQVRNAFSTEIRNYEVEGKAHVANASDPQVPAALAPVVSGIVSLNNFPRQSHIQLKGIFRKTAGKPGLRPLLTFPNPFGSGGNLYGMAPGDFAMIYNSSPLLHPSGTATPIDGTGQTIAIVGETNINVADVQAFRQMFGLPATFDSTNVILNGEDPGITSAGEEGEADLDTEWSGGVAPGATVKLVVSASTPASQGVDLSALYIIEHNLGDVMSESYGSCESSMGTAGTAFFNGLWEQAAAQGITVMVSTGDNGSAGCDNPNTQTTATHGLAVSGLASTPFNVAVGGTDFDDLNNWSTFWSSTNSATGTSVLRYIPEVPWNENCAQISLTGCGSSAPNGSVNIVAGSGGSSAVYGKPKWQMGVAGMPNDNHRDLPDVSLMASAGFDGTAYVYCQSDHTLSGIPACDITNASNGVLDFGLVGGTSASSPAFAGVMALVNQYQATHGGSSRQGNANAVLYALAKKSGASCTSSTTEGAGCIFNDITKGNTYIATRFGSSLGSNSVPCQGGTPNCSSSVPTTDGVLVDPAHTSTEAWTATAGYDRATGLGSVNITNLATNWGTVNTVPTTTTLTLSPTSGITHGTNENVSVTINVTPKSGTATGDVSLIAKFADGTTQGLDGFTLGANGAVTGTTSSLPGGTNYLVYAHYAGDGTNAPSDSAAVSLTVGQETSQTFIVIPSFDSSGTLLSGNSTSVSYGSNYIIRMYVTDKNGAANPAGVPGGVCYLVNLLTCPTGIVKLTADGTPLDIGGGGSGIFNLNNAGYTRDLAPVLSGGTHPLVAHYFGDNSYQASSSATTNFVVTPSPTQASAPIDYGTVVQAASTYINAAFTTQAYRAAAPTGTVTFYDGSNPLTGTIDITANAGNPAGAPAGLNAMITTSFATGGPHSVTASYSGDSNFAPSTSPPSNLTVQYLTTISQSESANNVNYPQNITITVTVTSTGKSPAMTGQIGLYGVQLGSAVYLPGTAGTDANGNQILTATTTVTPQVTGYISALYAGDKNFAPSQNSGDLVTVNIPDFSVAPAGGLIIAPVAPQPASAQITITPLSQTPSTVNLTLQGYTPNGYTVTLSPSQANLNGSAVTATISLTPNSSPSSTVHTEARRAGLVPAKPGNWWTLILLAGLGALFALGLPGRQRRYQAAFGISVFCLLLLALGCGGGSGSTGGGGGGGGGSSPQPTTITLATSNARAPQYTNFLITATVTGTSGKPLTGTVTFYNFGNPIGGGGQVINGQSQTGAGWLNNPGYFQITASYSGDTNNLSSTTPTPLLQVITGTIPGTFVANTGGDFHAIPVNIGVQ